MTVIPADLVLTGGVVHTMDPVAATAQAVAVTGGRIVAVGTAQQVGELVGPATQVEDLAGRTLIPGFQDAHLHPLAGGLEMLSCDLTDLDRAGCLAAVARYAADQPDAEWITGGGWLMAAFPGGLPLAADLDQVTGDRPAFLLNRDHHGAWVNTAALRRAGIDATTEDPADGRIERDAAGHPTGVLHEGAMALVERHVPKPTMDQQVRAMLATQSKLHALGITAWQDAIVGEYPGIPNGIPVYRELIERGQLTARVRGSLWWQRHRGVEQLETHLQTRQLAGGRLSLGAVKIMADGVCENFTAATLTPYLDGHGHSSENTGISFFSAAELTDALDALHGAGFQAHIHTIGERAVREALDAIESAIDRHGRKDLRHHLAHLQIVHPQDVPRFGRLGVVANMQPLWAYADDQMVELTIPYLGAERSGWQYPFASLAAHGAALAMGSDWPVSSPNPLWGMHVAVNRTSYRDDEDPAGPAHRPFLAGERLDAASVLRAATLGSAYVNHLDADTGSISVGKAADLAVLDADPLAIPADQLRHITVQATYVDGVAVYRR